MRTRPAQFESSRSLGWENRPSGSSNAVRTKRNGWKPSTLSRAVLASGTAFTIALIVTLAVLLWRNAQYGGIIISATEDDFSDAQVFLHRYLPIIIAVLYALFWERIDLDIKRLEPYYQLARPGGVGGSSSLALDYSSVFAPLVPYRSAQARHWNVLAISVICLLTTWVIIPLQNGIFTVKNTVVNDTIDIGQPYTLTSSNRQTERLTLNFLYDTSSILWLGEQLPPFTTRNSTLAPFTLGSASSGFNRTVHTSTTLYETDLACTDSFASISQQSSMPYAIFKDGDECSATCSFSLEAMINQPPGKFYSTYGPASTLEANSNDTECLARNKHKVCLSWAQVTPAGGSHINLSNHTIVLCNMSYYSQSVQAEISVADMKVLDIEPKAPRQVLSESSLNTTWLENILLSSALPTSDDSSNVYGSTLRLETFVRNMSLTTPIAAMTALAIGSTHFQPEEYANASKLASAYTSAHRLAFALAAGYLMDAPSNQTLSAASSTANFHTVSIVVVFAILTEVFLVIVAAISTFLLIAAPTRPSNIDEDPGNLAQTILLARDADVRQAVQYAYLGGTVRPNFNANAFFAVGSTESSIKPLLSVYNIGTMQAANQKREPPNRKMASLAVEPQEYRWYVILSFAAAMAGILATIITLYGKSSRGIGLSQPSTNANISQILTNVLPTLAATSVGLIWSWLIRCACVLAPLEALENKAVSAKKSLMLKYATLPPQLVVWAAIKNKGYLLGLLSIVTWTASVLTVAMSGIFVTRDTPIETPAEFAALYSGQVDFNRYGDSGFTSGTLDNVGAFDVVLANMTKQAPLPPWVSAKQFFLPFDLSSITNPADVTAINTVVPGYAVDPQCTEFQESSPLNNTYKIAFPRVAVNKTYISLSTTHRIEDGSFIECIPPWALQSQYANQSVGSIAGDPRGTRALEIVSAMDSNNTKWSDMCNEMVLFGWIRSKISLEEGKNVTLSGPSTKMNVSSTIVVCKPRLMTRTFNLSLSTSGSVINALAIDEPSFEVITTANFTGVLKVLTDGFIQTRQTYYHAWQNDSVPATTPGYIQSQITNSTAFLDPHQPPPSASVQIEMMNDLFTRVFATTMRQSLPYFLSASDTNDSPSLAVSASIVTSQRRVFLSLVPFSISIAILSLQILTAIIFYFTRPRPFLKRLPTSIAAQISLFANSHVVDDAVRVANSDFKELDRRGWKYGYGRFVGIDGRTDEGIERIPFVASLGSRQTSFERSWMRLFRRRDKVQRGEYGGITNYQNQRGNVPLEAIVKPYPKATVVVVPPQQDDPKLTLSTATVTPTFTHFRSAPQQDFHTNEVMSTRMSPVPLRRNLTAGSRVSTLSSSRGRSSFDHTEDSDQSPPLSPLLPAPHLN